MTKWPWASRLLETICPYVKSSVYSTPTCEVFNCLLCFGASMSAFRLNQPKKRKEKKNTWVFYLLWMLNLSWDDFGLHQNNDNVTMVVEVSRRHIWRRTYCIDMVQWNLQWEDKGGGMVGEGKAHNKKLSLLLFLMIFFGALYMKWQLAFVT